MRAGDRADDVKSALDVGDPVRIASLSASFSVFEPLSTGTTVAPSSFIRNTFIDWRLTSSDPMYTTHSMP